MNPFWKLLGVTALPPRDDARRLQYTKALERLLLASTAGAFFFALARNVPVHAQEFQLPPDWPYTLDRVLRYLSLIWFLAYFFVSSVNNDLSNTARRLKDLVFDTLQSISVLSATYCLGFVLLDGGFGFADGLGAFLFSNVVVVVICLFSLFLFSPGAPAGLNHVRGGGLVVGGIAAGVAACATRSVVVLLILVFLQLLLWVLLYAYFRLRLDG